jgi:hypothetical protein
MKRTRNDKPIRFNFINKKMKKFFSQQSSWEDGEVEIKVLKIEEKLIIPEYKFDKLKQIKKKSQHLPTQTYSKRYENLFDNKTNSDVKIKFKNGNIVYCHKLVLGATSECK